MEYQKIINPKTGRYVSINGRLGKSIIRNYLNFLKGDGRGNTFFGQSGGASSEEEAIRDALDMGAIEITPAERLERQILRLENKNVKLRKKIEVNERLIQDLQAESQKLGVLEISEKEVMGEEVQIPNHIYDGKKVDYDWINSLGPEKNTGESENDHKIRVLENQIRYVEEVIDSLQTQHLQLESEEKALETDLKSSGNDMIDYTIQDGLATPYTTSVRNSSLAKVAKRKEKKKNLINKYIEFKEQTEKKRDVLLTRSQMTFTKVDKPPTKPPTKSTLGDLFKGLFQS